VISSVTKFIIIIIVVVVVVTAMNLVPTQPLTKMSTWDIRVSWGVKAAGMYG